MPTPTQSLRHCLLATFMLVWLSACEKAPQNPSTAQSPREPVATQVAVFDAAKVREQYANTPLTVLDVSERGVEGKNVLVATFSVPLDPSVNQKHLFVVSDKDGNPVDGAWVLDPSGRTAHFDNTEPATRYTVEIDAELTAANGEALGNYLKMNITTRDLKPSIGFDSDGHFLAKGVSEGLGVVTINVEEVDIDFFRIDDNNTDAFLDYVDNSYYLRYYLDRVTKLGKLVYSGRYAFDAPKNTRTERTINLSRVDELQPSGIYLAVMREAGDYENTKTLWFSVTDLGLHVRKYDSELSVWVSSLKTGKPLGNIEVSLFDRKHNALKQLKTDALGLAKFVGLGNNVGLVVARTADQYSLLPMKQAALDLSEFDLGTRPQLPVELFIYAPRDLYRPGEVADFSALIRDGDGRQTQAAVLKATVKRPDNSEFASFDWHPGKLGYYHHTWQIPADAPVGNWTLEVTGPLKAPQVYPFKVEEFLPERMKLTFNDNQPRLVVDAKQTIQLPVLGEYLYGAPAGGNRLSTRVSISPWRSPIESLKHYRFGSPDTAHNDWYDLNDLSLDATGNGTLEIESRWQDSQTPLNIKTTSSLYESGGRPVTRQYSTLVWPHQAMIGIRENFEKGDGHDGPKANSQVKFDIVSATVEGELLAAKELQVTLIKHDRNYFWVHDDSRGWYYQWTDKQYTEASQTVNIEKGQQASVSFMVNYGQYELEVRDVAGKRLSSVQFYAGYNWYEHWRDAQDGTGGSHPDKVTIAWDKGSYQAGDEAKATIVPPQSGEAVVMVEGDHPLWVKRVSVDKEGTTITVPVSKDWQQHNLYLSVMVLKGADKTEKIAPNRAMGLAHLPLDRQNRKLAIDIDIADKLMPQQKVDVQLAVTADGKPVDGEHYLTLAAVDVGVLSISNFATPQPFEHFFGRRAYSATARDIYDKVIKPATGADARLRFGGDADLSRGGKKPATDVQIVSMFKTPIKVENGQATATLDLPDFNGRLRLMALSFGEDSFGSSDKEVTVAAPVVTQLAMPRFLAAGDETTVALDLNNLTEQPQQLTITAMGEGPIALEQQTDEVTLLRHQRKTLNYRVKGLGVTGQGIIKVKIDGMTVDGQSTVIEKQWRIGLRAAYPAVTRQYHKILAPGERFSIDHQALGDLLSDTAALGLSVDNMPNLDLSGQFDDLLAYPYGCLEQTSSRVFPLIFADEQVQQLMGLKSLTEQERQKMLQAGLERISSLQLPNGGFGLWSNRSDEEHWLTAYVGELLVTAKRHKVDFHWQLQDKTLSRLKKYLQRRGRFVGERYSEDPDEYTFAYKAYAAYVLSFVNQAPLGTLRQLDNQYKDFNGLAAIQLGVALSRMGDKKRGLKAIDRGIGSLGAGRGYRADYGSAIRDMAMAVHLLLSQDLRTKQAFDISIELAELLRHEQWLSTQERNALFMAGMAMARFEVEAWQGELKVGDTRQKLSQKGLMSRKFASAALSGGISIRSQSRYPLYVGATLTGYPKERPAPQQDGMGIERRWLDQNGKAVDPTQVKVGDLVIVHLKVDADRRTPDALVVDLLPTGFELENQNLAHSVSLDDFKVDGVSMKGWQTQNSIKHVEYRDDRFVAALDVSKHGYSNLFYLLRAVTPGSYVVPPPMVEDMYSPRFRAVGATIDKAIVTQP